MRVEENRLLCLSLQKIIEHLHRSRFGDRLQNHLVLAPIELFIKLMRDRHPPVAPPWLVEIIAVIDQRLRKDRMIEEMFLELFHRDLSSKRGGVTDHPERMLHPVVDHLSILPDLGPDRFPFLRNGPAVVLQAGRVFVDLKRQDTAEDLGGPVGIFRHGGQSKGINFFEKIKHRAHFLPPSDAVFSSSTRPVASYSALYCIASSNVLIGVKNRWRRRSEV